MRLLSFVLLFCNVFSNIVTLTDTNHVSIVNQISESTASKFINDIQPITESEIYIYIKSPGGEVPAGEKIIQYIRYKRHQNHTLLCIAESALSMAFHIYQHCDERIVLPNSVIMQHQMSLQVGGSLENINSYLSMINNVNNQLILSESERLEITPDEYKNRIVSDWWIYGKDIITQNVGDRMIDAVGCDTKLLQSTQKVIMDGILLKQSLCPLLN